MALTLVVDRGKGLQMCRIAANILNKQSRIVDKGLSYNLDVGLTSPHQETSKIRNVAHGLGLGQSLWDDLRNGRHIQSGSE
jgi:hypothetical protein